MSNEVFFAVPVKGWSRRLERKNVREVLGKPLFVYTLDAITESKHYVGNESSVWVFTESRKVADLVHLWGFADVHRPLEWRLFQTGIIRLAKRIRRSVDPPAIVCIVYANCPARDPATIDRCIDLVLDGCHSVRTYNGSGRETGNVWAFDPMARWDTYTGFVRDDSIEIHTQADLDVVADTLRDRELDRIARETMPSMEGLPG